MSDEDTTTNTSAHQDEDQPETKASAPSEQEVISDDNAPDVDVGRAVPVNKEAQADPLPSKNDPSSLLDDKHRVYDAETTVEKLKYPKSVFFIISNEFCERFSYYGMRTILVLYLEFILRYSEDNSTIIYHVFTMLCYFFPLIGSMIADSWLGKFRTIFYLSCVYALGNIVISIASADEAISAPARELSILGLLLIAIGTGGIKPCVSAFGGDQFKLPEQEKQMAQFFSLFYFAINSGSFLSTFLTPVLRDDVTCLGEDSCYPLAFGIPAILMIVSIVVFVAGKSLYIVKKPQGNVVLQVCKTMGHAIGNKWSSKGEKRDHWLDYADDKYPKKQIEDIKSALRVLFLYLPLPFFWALFDQQGSRWTFQAKRMTGDLGGWSLKPDQMQVINPLLILLFIPLFETCLYPLLKKCNLLTKPLQRLGVGGVLAGVAFGVSAIIELKLESTYAVLPSSGEGQIRILNGLNCDLHNVMIGDIGPQTIEEFDMWVEQHWDVDVTKTASIKYKDCDNNDKEETFVVVEKQATTYILNSGPLIPVPNDIIDKSDKANTARLRIYSSTIEPSYVVNIGGTVFNMSSVNLQGAAVSYPEDLTPHSYSIKINGEDVGSITVKVGGVYALLIENYNGKYEHKLSEITSPNSVHMLWLIPQYIVITMAEVMFSVTGLEFSYSQAPLSMKSLMQAGWLLTVAFGNLIVVIIAEAKIFERQLFEFLLFAGLMFIDMLIFSLMAMGYKYVDAPQDSPDAMPLENSKEKSGVDNKTFKSEEE